MLVIAAVATWIAEEYTPEGDSTAASPPLPKVRKRQLLMVDPGVPSDQRIFLTMRSWLAASRLEIESIEASSSLIEIVGISRVTATPGLMVIKPCSCFHLDRKDHLTIREGLVVSESFGASRYKIGVPMDLGFVRSRGNGIPLLPRRLRPST